MNWSVVEKEGEVWRLLLVPGTAVSAPVEVWLGVGSVRVADPETGVTLCRLHRGEVSAQRLQAWLGGAGLAAVLRCWDLDCRACAGRWRLAALPGGAPCLLKHFDRYQSDGLDAPARTLVAVTASGARFYPGAEQLDAPLPASPLAVISASRLTPAALCQTMGRRDAAEICAVWKLNRSDLYGVFNGGVKELRAA